jgi:hypothetical protein
MHLSISSRGRRVGTSAICLEGSSFERKKASAVRIWRTDASSLKTSRRALFGLLSSGVFVGAVQSSHNTSA